MAAMKRERQFDMFDVATGVCELDDYLTQRYSENDISSKFWIEPADQVDELRAPQDGKPVIIAVQGPSVIQPTPTVTHSEPLPTRPPWEQVAASDNPLPARPSWETPTTPSAPAPATPLPSAAEPSVQSAPVTRPAVEPLSLAATPPAELDGATEAGPAPLLPPSMADLLAQFHQATKAYEERAKDEPPL